MKVWGNSHNDDQLTTVRGLIAVSYQEMTDLGQLQKSILLKAADRHISRAHSFQTIPPMVDSVCYCCLARVREDGSIEESSTWKVERKEGEG